MPADPSPIVLPENLLMKNRFCCCLSVTLIIEVVLMAHLFQALFL